MRSSSVALATSSVRTLAHSNATLTSADRCVSLYKPMLLSFYIISIYMYNICQVEMLNLLTSLLDHCHLRHDITSMVDWALQLKYQQNETLSRANDEGEA